MSEQSQDIHIEEKKIRLAELQLKEKEYQLKKQNNHTSWRKTILIPVVIAVIAAFANALFDYFQSFEKIKNSGSNETFKREHTKILTTLDLSEIKRLELLCVYHHSQVFQHPDSVDILTNLIAEDPNCSEKGYIKEQLTVSSDTSAPPESITLNQCKAKAKPITTSCRAFDKSGFHSKPSDSCTLNLVAGEDMFFAQKQVKVVSEYYRRNAGQTAVTAVTAKINDTNGLIESFSGKIRCSNSAGTGRTCEARATIRANSYPLICSKYAMELEKN